MSRFTLAITISGIILLSVGVVWFAAARGELVRETIIRPFGKTTAFVPATPPPSTRATHAEALAPKPSPKPVATETSATKRYSDPEFDFSFDYPADHTVRAFFDDTGYVVLVSKPGSTEFQVYVQPYDDPGPLTPEKLHDVDPGFLISNPTVLNFPDIPASTLAFSSQYPEFGPTYEIWFPYDHHLYQLTTYDASRDLLMDALNSWGFASSSTL